MVFIISLGNFRGIDSLIEFLIVIVSFIISYYSYRVYKIIKENHYLYFSFSFLSVGVSFIFKIFSNLTIVHKIVVENANFVFTLWSQYKYINLINFFSFIFYKSFHLIGFLILFLLITKTEKKENIALFLYLSFITVLSSIFFNFIFHLTLVIILLFLTFYFYENHLKIKSKNSLLVFIAFLIMLTSHLFFIFSDFNSLFYLIGEILLLIGFLCLLLNQINLKGKAKNETKKNKTRSHKGYIKNFERKARG